MKIPTILIILLLARTNVFAQDPEVMSTKIKSASVGIGAGIGRLIAISGVATINCSNNTYYGLHVMGTFFPPINKPENYSDPVYTPRDNLISFSALFGKRFHKKESRFFFALEGGISWVRYNQMTFTLSMPGLWSIYYTDYKTTNKPGLLLGARITHAVTPYLSLDLSTHGSINAAHSVITGNFSVIITLFKEDFRSI